MKDKGYKRKGKLFYKIEHSMAFCIEFEIPSQLLYVAFYVLPLYIPHENRNLTYGIRQQFNGVKIRRNAQGKQIADDVCWHEEFLDYADTYIFPWFDRIRNCGDLIAAMENQGKKKTDCSDIHMLKLQYFTFAFCGEYEKALQIAPKYRKLIQTTTWLTDTVKKMLYNELDTVCDLLEGDHEAIVAWFEQTIKNSITSCALH